MRYLKLFLPFFVLLISRVQCSVTLKCDLAQKTSKKIYKKATEAFLNKIEEISACGEVLEKGNRAKYHTCIQKIGIAEGYRSDLVGWNKSDFENEDSLIKAIERIGKSFCEHQKGSYFTPDSELETIGFTLDLTENVVMELESEKPKDKDKDKREEANKIKDKDDESKSKGNGDGVKQTSTSNNDISSAKVNEPKTNTVEGTPFYRTQTFIITILFIIMLSASIYFFIRGRRIEKKVLTPPTPMQPIHPLEPIRPKSSSPPPEPKRRESPAQPMKQTRSRTQFHEKQQQQQAQYQQQQSYPQQPVQRVFPSPSPPQFISSPILPSNYPNSPHNTSTHSFGSNQGIPNDEPPPSYNEIHRPFHGPK